MTNELNSLTAEFLPAIEDEMRAVLGAAEDGPGSGDPFYGMIHYHMGWADEDLNPIDVKSGKRIRPILCLLACAAAGGDWRTAVPAAAAVEIIHNFSLVHDDIEDNSTTRRGRSTLWTVWGQAQAINTGDAMFAMAHLALNRLVERGISPEIVVRGLRRLDEASIELTRGQYTDMSFETRDEVGVDEYIMMITGKTAVLTSLCTELGALVAGADETRVRHFAEFGLYLGLAFQIQDDILGIWGDEAVTGKSTATDIITRKKTLPVLYALARSRELKELYRDERNGDGFVSHVVTELDEIGAREFTLSQAGYYTENAIDSLTAAQPAGPAAAALHQLTDMLLRRDS